MALDASDARELFDQEFSFPVERAEVIEAVGDTAVVAPTGDSVQIASVLERSETGQYESVTELYNTLQANLDDEHVGRKEYDDRSSSPARDDERSF